MGKQQIKHSAIKVHLLIRLLGVSLLFKGVFMLLLLIVYRSIKD